MTAFASTVQALLRPVHDSRAALGRGRVGRALLHLISVLLAAGTLAAATTAPPSPARAAAYGRLPFRFEANCGQADDSVRFLARARDHTIYLTANGAVLALMEGAWEDAASRIEPERGAKTSLSAAERVVSLSFPGAAMEPKATGLGPTAGQINYLIGRESKQWHQDIPTFARVRYERIYPGVDLIYYGNDRQLEFDFVVAAGADPRAVAMRYEGAHELSIDREGNLVVRVGASRLRQHRPVAYQTIGGRRREVSVQYRLRDRATVTFALGSYNPARPLTIDPVLSYATFLGGAKADVGWAIAADAAGNAYIAGDTLAIFKKLPASGFQTNFGGGTKFGGDAFVAKIDPTGTNLLYLTYLGGSGLDGAVGLAIDSAGAAYVTGYTDSTNFPVAGTAGPASVLQPRIAGTNVTEFNNFHSDAFVAKLDPSGSSLVYSTYLGGEDNETGIDITVDSAGAAYVVGATESALTYWVTNQIGTRTCTNGICGNITYVTNQAVVRLLINTQYATNVVKVDIKTNIPPPFITNEVDKVFVTNLLYARQATFGFPITNAVQTNGTGLKDMFVSKLTPDGSQLAYSTYLGGFGTDFATGVGVDAAGNAVVAGWTDSGNFPLTNAIQAYPGGGRDAVVAKFDATGAWIYSTYLGGQSDDAAYRVAVDSAGNAFVVGADGSPDFPTTPGSRIKGGVYQSTDGGGSWSLASAGLTSADVRALLADPFAPGLLYAGTPRGVFKSTDNGATWAGSSTGLVNRTVITLALHPADHATVFAGTLGGLSRSTDAGGNWTNLTIGLGSSRVRALLFEPGNATTIYAGTAAGVFKSTDDSTNWVAVNRGLRNHEVNALAVDPLNPALIYAATAGGVYQSTNAGTNWKSSSVGLTTHRTQALAVDPSNALTLYAGTVRGFFKSSNGATNWMPFTNGLGRPSINTLLLDPAVPTTLYLGTTNGLFKSLDAGTNWLASQTNLDSLNVSLLTLATGSPLFAATRGTNFLGGTNDAFLLKLVPDGSALAYAFTFGGTRDDEAWDVAVDGTGSAFVTGHTTSRNFPTAGAAYPAQTNLAGRADVFVAQFDPTGASNVFSILLGGTHHDIAHGIALDGSGGIYIVGQTESPHFLSTNAVQPLFGGGPRDAFLLKLDPPAPAPPAALNLAVARSGKTVTLRWPVCRGKYVVEGADSYLGPWTPLPALPVIHNGQNSITLPASSAGSRFFRLRCR